ncbi:MAG: DUF423 domain-containing protein [Pseudomonadota bacterium]
MPWLAAAGAVLAASAVALAAYASHAAAPEDRMRLFMAAAFAFGHGASLAVLATDVPRRLGRGALVALLAGTLLFAGSLAGAALAGLPTRLAPAGGMLLMAGWLMLAIDRARA